MNKQKNHADRFEEIVSPRSHVELISLNLVGAWLRAKRSNSPVWIQSKSDPVLKQ